MSESELFAAYKRVQAKNAIGEFNFFALADLVEKIEREEFQNQAGYLTNFVPWHEIKDIFGMIYERQ